MIKVINIKFSLKTNKSPGHDNLLVNVIRNPYKELKNPVMNICNLSLTTRFFSNITKIAKATPIFKKGEKWSIPIYRPLSNGKQYIEYVKDNKTGKTGVSKIIREVLQPQVLGHYF